MFEGKKQNCLFQKKYFLKKKKKTVRLKKRKFDVLVRQSHYYILYINFKGSIYDKKKTCKNVITFQKYVSNSPIKV